LENNPHLSVNEVVARFRWQRIAAGLLPVTFLGLLIGGLVITDRFDLNAGLLWLLLGGWVAVVVALFASARAVKGGKVVSAVFLVPVMFPVEFVIGLFTVMMGTLVSGIGGIVAAIVLGQRPPGYKASTVHQFKPEGQ
jgi:hypothetical protein